MHKIKKIIMVAVAIIFPWLIMFLEDKPGAGVLALILQVSCIGWPLATIWAYGIVKESLQKEEDALKASKA